MKKESFEHMLTGGHPNSLGRTIEVVDLILKDESLLKKLYECYSSEDEVVRLRTSSAFKRVTKENPDWVLKYIDRFLKEISGLKQASAQWTLAQLLLLLDKKLSDAQRKEGQKVLKHNLETWDDWIVLNMTMETLTHWSKNDEILRRWLVPHLEKLKKDERKSVARRAEKFLGVLGE